MSSSDELLLVQELPMDMQSDGGAGERRLAHVLPPLARAPGPPPFRPPPPPSAVTAAEFRVAFRGWLGAPRHWELWVAKLRPIHERLWRELGILDALLASTYRLKRDASAVLHLASFWSPGTNTFAFPWGEATITLEDVAVLGGFRADGSPVRAPLAPQWDSDEAALNGVRLDFNRSACKKAHHAAWLTHFLTDTDMDTVIEHAAFLALWLTRFVLPGHPESTMRQSLFPLAVRMARGDRVALGPAVLASLYRDLREMKTYLVAAGTTGGNAELLSPLSVHAPLYILQLWMWERFPMLCDGNDKPVNHGEPRAARWHDVSNKISPMAIREVLISGTNFMWKSYPSYYQHNHHSGWVHGSDITKDEELVSLAHCLHACELVGMDCIEQYLPHRVAMQFGLDQDVPGDVARANEDWEVAWETYDLEGKKLAVFIPHSEPGVTARYAQWWSQPLPSSDFGVGAGNISVERKVSKRKVKKTLAALEAEEEKERKMKKARASLNNGRKPKLEELYDAKLSAWLATARNGSSGTDGGPGGSCKRPKYDDALDKPLLASVRTSKDDIVPLVPRKQLSTPAVNLKRDRDMNLDRAGKLLTGSKYKGVNLKGSMAGDVYHPVNEPYAEEEAVVSAEISSFNEDAKGEWSNEILKKTNELVRGETPNVPNRPEEFKPPLCMENEECSDHLSDVDCSEDDRWSTDGTRNQEALDLDKQQAMEGRQDLGPTIRDKKMTMPGDAITPSCSEFQIISPEAKINEVMSTKGIQDQEHFFNKEEQVLEKGLECKITEGNARPLVVTNALGGGGVDTTLITVDVNNANCVEGIQNQEACSSEEMQAGQDKQHTGVGDVRILQDTSTNYSGDVGTEKDLCMKGLAVLEKQDKGTTYENTKRTLVDIDVPECGEAEHGGTMKMIHETYPTVQVVNMAEDKISSKNKQNSAVLEKLDKGTTDENTEGMLVDTDAPDCGGAEHDGTMKMIHETDSTVQAFNRTEDKISSKNKQNPVVLEKQDEGTTYENTERTLVDTVAPECGEAKYDGTMKMIDETYSAVQAVNMVEDKTSSKDKQILAVPEKRDEGTIVENTERTLVDTDAPECGEVKHDGTMKMIHEADSTVQAVNMAEDKISSKNRQNPAVLEKLDKATTDENTEGMLIDTDAPECGEAKCDGTMKMIGQTDSAIQDVNMAEDKILSKNKQNLTVLEELDEQAIDENTERTMVDTDTPQCGEEKHDGTMKMIHATDSTVQAVNRAKHKISSKDKQNLALLEKRDEGTIDENTERTLVDTDAPECGEAKHDGTMKMIHGADSTVQAVNMAEDKISSKNRQNPAVLEKLDKATTDKNTEGMLVDTDAPECGEAKCDGTMKMIGETDSAIQDVNMAEDKILSKNKPNLAVLEELAEQTIDENTERTMVDTDTPQCGEEKHDGTMKMIHATDSTVQAVNRAKHKISFKNKQKVVPLEDHDKSDVECSGSDQTARKELKRALQPDLEHEVEVKHDMVENRKGMSSGKKNNEASEQEQTSTEDAPVAPSGIENNNEWAEEPIKSYGKYASDSVNTGCPTSKVGRPSIEDVRRIHSGRSVYLKDIKESQGRICSEPSNRTHINNAGYCSRHEVQEPVTVCKDIKVPLHDTVSVCGRDHALDLSPEETPGWRQEQYALNILKDVQNARTADKTKMEMEIRILKAQIVSMQKQLMNMDRTGEVISRSKRH